ncbi:hypothetical protein Nepgr_009941 [Nepenthes gracilis]|uniref:Histone H2A n=1 Tax=Nepenthes gracilis TaxID=150966 RepID=A0AAD3XKX0_NEPGR|nr:hypothetical protein Nepgr_009941 [Nepenthes gracilis]
MEDTAKLKKGAAGRKGGDPKKKAVTRSVKAGLQFPVGRIGRFLKKAGMLNGLALALRVASPPSSNTLPSRFWS